MAGEILIVSSFFVVKPRPWGIKGENVGYLPQSGKAIQLAVRTLNSLFRLISQSLPSAQVVHIFTRCLYNAVIN